MSDIAEDMQSPPDGEKSQPDFNFLDIISKLTPKSEDDHAQSESKSNPDLLSSILSNPELLSALPRLISIISSLSGSFTKRSDTDEAQKGVAQSADALQNQSTSDYAKVFKNQGNIQTEIRNTKSEADSRAALLCAMKPYLCRDRQNAIDYFVKLSRLGEILKTL